MAKYGMPTERAASDWEAWLKRQPAGDLQEMTEDPETDPETVAFIRAWLGPECD